MKPLFQQGLTPRAASANMGSSSDLAEFLQEHPNLFVITGAGISQASGIPTYRDDGGVWRSNIPIHHAEYMRDPAKRKRYWARSFGGWPNVQRAEPNQAHHALAGLEALGIVSLLVTQNVDRLHQKAGHKKVVDLHGRMDQVLCMDCGAITSRDEIQEWLWQHNPHLANIKAVVAPDGDAEVQQSMIDRVITPDCQRCSGLLKPHVVFYGSSVEKHIVTELMANLLQASAVLVVGSSLMVYSSYRFCKLAAEQNIPIACINQGLTRADELFALKVNGECGAVLGDILDSLQQQNPDFTPSVYAADSLPAR